MNCHSSSRVRGYQRLLGVQITMKGLRDSVQYRKSHYLWRQTRSGDTETKSEKCAAADWELGWDGPNDPEVNLC